jgi:hypothetical protein
MSKRDMYPFKQRCNRVRDPGNEKHPTPRPTTRTLLVKKIVVCKDDTATSIVRDECPNPEDFKITVTGTIQTQIHSREVKVALLLHRTCKVSDDEHTDFKTEFSGDCNANGSGTIKVNEHQTCTITNTEQDKEMKNY